MDWLVSGLVELLITLLVSSNNEGLLDMLQGLSIFSNKLSWEPQTAPLCLILLITLE